MKFASALSVVIALLGVSLVAHAEPTKPDTPLAIAKSVKGLVGVRDAMREITWYKNSASPKYDNTNTFYLYFGITDDQSLTPLRLKITYASDTWLFIQSAWGKADGKRVSIPQSSETLTGWERDNGKIWEWSDAPVETANDIATLRQIARAKEVTLRFEGRQYYSDRPLSAAHLQAIREMISAYEVVSAKPWQ